MPKQDLKSAFSADFLASIVVFLVALPLCMGIAIASGAPPASGLITGIVGGLVVAALSGCPLQVSGPAAGLAVIIYELIQTHGFAGLAPIIVAAGVIQLIAGMLKVGQVFRAIAPAVVYGMLAGIGVLIFAAQFHVMVDDTPRENGIQNILAIPEAIYKGGIPTDGTPHHLAAFVGMLTIVSLLAWQKLAPKVVSWIPGALIGVVAGTAVATLWGMPISFVDIPDNFLGQIELPAWSAFAGLASGEMLLAAFTLAFVASAETLLSATAVDKMHDGPRTNYDRELLSQGVGNIVVGAIGGLPMTGVIVRSSANVGAGAKTRKSAMMHGVWLLVLVAFLPGILRLVPTASLAAVLVYTGYKLVNPANIRKLKKYGRFPLVVYAVTVIMVVATDLLTGIVTGLTLALAGLLYGMSHVSIDLHEDKANNRIHLHLGGAATFMRLPRLADTLESLPLDKEVHVHFANLQYVDDACMEALSTWEQKRNAIDNGAATFVEWEELVQRYERTPLPQMNRAKPAEEVSTTV